MPMRLAISHQTCVSCFHRAYSKLAGNKANQQTGSIQRRLEIFAKEYMGAQEYMVPMGFGLFDFMLQTDAPLINFIGLVMTADTSVKSIIYGNCFSNSYGRFRALCAALTQKQHIERAMGYLRTVDNLKKFNKFVYAYRLEESKAVFMTEDSKSKLFSQGFNEDSGLEGNGERLLHIMQRFNVRNILLIVAIGQKDPLKQFNSEHQMTLVRCAKELLISLYQKVIPENEEAQFQTKSIPQKLFVLPDIYQPPKFKDSKLRENNRPNYVGQLFISERHKTKDELRKTYETKYLNSKIKDLAYDLENLLSCLGQQQNASIRFTIQYDQSEEVARVIRLLLLLFGLQSRFDLLKANMSVMLRQVSIRTLSNKTINSLNLMLLSQPSLRSGKVAVTNKLLGIVVEFIQALMKSYGFAKRIAMIETANQEVKQKKQVKRKSKSMIARRGVQEL